ncbi:hypothetical protein A7M79_00035 [Acinetobacter baumannii]|uniref:hypothetical protein n=1 Tax=Acinetobacter baumannii TaxID=470 RepID=UPI0008DD1EC0|nr:hypothetical protein [Acinetobacter baumannii]OIH11911.1 hypothetical protein A7M79_00035 [Acinetobacter baumannii]
MSLWGQKIQEIQEKEIKAEIDEKLNSQTHDVNKDPLAIKAKALSGEAGGQLDQVSPENIEPETKVVLEHIEVAEQPLNKEKVQLENVDESSSLKTKAAKGLGKKSPASKKNDFDVFLMEDGKYQLSGSLAGALRKSKKCSTFKVVTPKVMHNFIMISKFSESLTAIEIVNLLIIDAVEKDTLPISMLKRYKKAVGQLDDSKIMTKNVVDFKDDQIVFNEVFSSKVEHESMNDFVVAIYPVHREIYNKFLILKLKHEVSIVEAFHILIADFMEKKKIPTGVKKRYLDGQ